ncbi:MAG: complex I subunit 5 family protein [Candidatus Geothermincolia bacterium]
MVDLILSTSGETAAVAVEHVAPASSVLPLLLILLPLIGLLGVIALRRREGTRNLVAAVTAFATAGAAIALATRVVGRGPVYFDMGGFVRLPERFGLRLEVDALGAVFALLASIAWGAAMLHAADYLWHEERRARFSAYMMAGEAMTLGVFLAADFLTLYVFFELMGLVGYMLIVHNQSGVARAAATKYLYLAVMGGLTLLGGIFLYYSYAGTLGFVPQPGSAMLAEPFRGLAILFLVLGFGVKAGMVPLHVWLPDAHPAAPSPASAILSGVMIKTGAYGIIRTTMAFFTSASEHGANVVESTKHVLAAAPAHAEAGGAAQAATHAATGLARGVQTMGFAIIWLAAATMFIGMLLALFQTDIKRTLAYSSVSQMGYILMGVGTAGYLGAEGVLGLSGSVYHVLNHGLFKACLFLAAGSILFRAHRLDMFNLGGLWRRMPLTTIAWCVAALGIMGIPLFNGFASKTLLHHAIVESAHLAGGGGVGGHAWMQVVEWIFIITSGGTICYIAKTTWLTFFRKPRDIVEPHEHIASEHDPHGHEPIREAPRWMAGATGLLAAGVLFFGLFPGLILRNLAGPAAGVYAGIEAGPLSHINFFTWANVKEIGMPLLIGAALLGLLTSLGLWRLRLPRWLGVDFWYLRSVDGLFWTLRQGGKGMALARAGYGRAWRGAVRGFNGLATGSRGLGEGVNRALAAGWSGLLAGLAALVGPERAPGAAAPLSAASRIGAEARSRLRRIPESVLAGGRKFAAAVRTGRYSEILSTFHWDLGIGVVGLTFLLALFLVVLIQ